MSISPKWDLVDSCPLPVGQLAASVWIQGMKAPVWPEHSLTYMFMWGLSVEWVVTENMRFVYLEDKYFFIAN